MDSNFTKIFINERPLAREFHLKVPVSGMGVLRTVGDAAMFIGKLDPNKYSDSLHWMTAGTAIQAADNDPANNALLDHATNEMENALRSDGFLHDEDE